MDAQIIKYNCENPLINISIQRAIEIYGYDTVIEMLEEKDKEIRDYIEYILRKDEIS